MFQLKLIHLLIYLLLGQREQLNVASAYIDGTSVYGHNEYEARKLRTFSKGKFLTNFKTNGSLNNMNNIKWTYKSKEKY